MHFVSRRAALALGLACAIAAPAFADSWPANPIRLVVPFTAGGGTDILARQVAKEVTQQTHWSFIVDNKGGAGGNLGVDNVVKSPADGYNLVIGQTSNLAINPTLYPHLPYNPVKDLTPISLIGSSPLVFVVASNSPYHSLAEIVAAARARPGTINVATSGNGTVSHMALELLMKDSGVKFQHVPYKGASQGLTDLIGGNVQVYISSVPTLIGQIQTGKLRPLAVTSTKRVRDLPQVPAIAETYKGFEAVTWFGLLGPAKLPADITTRLSAAVNKALQSADLRKKLGDQGLDVEGSTPEQFAHLIQSEIAKWAPIVKGSGVTLD
jgi:tripartite-type tricarboxylate transporter receptor subunit TctC